MKTAIIIVNYKTPWHLKECLKSIWENTNNFHVILVHNSIDAESIKVSDFFKSKYPNDITVIVNEKNLGLVGGVNSAYEEAKNFKRVCFLNSDIIVTKGWLDELNNALDENPNAVQVAPDLNHYYEEGKIWRLIKWQIMRRNQVIGSRLYKLLLKFNPPRSKDSDTGFRASNLFYQFCTGACNLVRIEPFIERGYFWDPNIIHGYGDDFDTSYFLRQYGEIGVTNKAYVFHFHNISFNKFSSEKSELKRKLQLYNMLYVINKWEDRIKKDLASLDRDELLRLSESSYEVQMMLKYFGMAEIDLSFKDFVKSTPAREIGMKLLN